jgi:hypothetical protein
MGAERRGGGLRGREGETRPYTARTMPVTPRLERLTHKARSEPQRRFNAPSGKHLFRLRFIEKKANVILLGGVGLGKTHLATALGYAACQNGHSVLFVHHRCGCDQYPGRRPARRQAQAGVQPLSQAVSAHPGRTGPLRCSTQRWCLKKETSLAVHSTRAMRPNLS